MVIILQARCVAAFHSAFCKYVQQRGHARVPETHTLLHPPRSPPPTMATSHSSEQLEHNLPSKAPALLHPARQFAGNVGKICNLGEAGVEPPRLKPTEQLPNLRKVCREHAQQV